MNEWIKEFPAAITVCDSEGKITEMNDKSRVAFEKDGGEKLIGQNLFDCHPEPAKSKLKTLLKSKKENVYTTEKDGKKKLILHSPWFEQGIYRGFVELSLEIPFEIPNFVRDLN
jgi:transcriptional regulator with PAS, ATPase and Fis domain